MSVISGNIIGQTQTLTLFVESSHREYNTGKCGLGCRGVKSGEAHNLLLLPASEGLLGLLGSGGINVRTSHRSPLLLLAQRPPLPRRPFFPFCPCSRSCPRSGSSARPRSSTRGTSRERRDRGSARSAHRSLAASSRLPALTTALPLVSLPKNLE